MKGESRLCLNVLDETSGLQTEILEAGPVISEAEWGELKVQMARLAAESEFVVFSGSLPQGLSDDVYAQLIRIVYRHQAKPIVNTSGSALEKALAEKPFMVKPNRDKLAAMMQVDHMTETEILKVIDRWSEQGIPLIVVSLGSDGALVAYGGQYFKATPPSIQAINRVGCGDTLVAGMAAGLIRGLEFEEILSLATAAAAANATEPQAGSVKLDKIHAYRERVKINRIGRLEIDT